MVDLIGIVGETYRVPTYSWPNWPFGRLYIVYTPSDRDTVGVCIDSIHGAQKVVISH